MTQSPDRDEPQAGDNVVTHLRSIVDRIERLEIKRKNLGEDVKDIFKEAKSHGLDVKALRQLIRERRQTDDKREEIESLVEVYRRALGDYQTTDLGSAAIKAVA